MNVSITFPVGSVMAARYAIHDAIKRQWKLRHDVFYRREIRALVEAQRALRKV